jgi:2-oxoisovalerate dehydrogenase E1 component beta subunit
MNIAAEVTYVQAIDQALREEMARDNSVMLIGPEIEGMDQGDFDTERSVLSSLSGSPLAGVALGSALMGMRPVVMLQDSHELADAFSQIADGAARLYWRSGGDLYAPMVLRVPFATQLRNADWRSTSPEAGLAHVPGLKVVMPSTPYDAKGLMKAAIRDNDPVVMLEPRYLYNRLREELPEEDYIVPIGTAEVRRTGDHLTIIAYGAMVYIALDAADLLAEDGISTEVIDLRTLAPLDLDLLSDSIQHTRKALIVHADTLNGGFGAEIAATLAERCNSMLDGPVTRVAAPDLPPPQSSALEAAYLPDVAAICDAARKLLHQEKS